MKIKGYTVGNKSYVSVDDLVIFLYSVKEDLSSKGETSSIKNALFILKQLIKDLNDVRES